MFLKFNKLRSGSMIRSLRTLTSWRRSVLASMLTTIRARYLSGSFLTSSTTILAARTLTHLAQQESSQNHCSKSAWSVRAIQLQVFVWLRSALMTFYRLLNINSVETGISRHGESSQSIGQKKTQIQAEGFTISEGSIAFG